MDSLDSISFTVKDLVELLSPQSDKSSITPTVNFVIYARKSPESEERQVRSLDDQIAECYAMASAKGYRVIEVIREEKSAKD